MTTGQHGEPPERPPSGYAPAPSAPAGDGAAAPVERPLTVRAGCGAFVGAAVLGLAGSLVSAFERDALREAVLERSGADLDGTGLDPVRFADTVVTAGIAFSVAVAMVFLLVTWAAWRGRNWGRIVLFVLGTMFAVLSLPGLVSGTSALLSLTALSAAQWLATVTGVVLVALRPSGEWYRYQKWRRAEGLPRPGP